MSDIRQRKADHIDLCATDQVAFRERTTLLEGVRLIHQALPDLSLDEIDLRCELFGKTLRAPLIVASMTGGTERAERINRIIAEVVEKRGLGMGLGSQRAMQKRPETTKSFQVRELAPTALILGNLGVVQAREQPTEALKELVESVGADGLFIHLNPAMELIQPEGDRDFRGGTETFARLVRELPLPVVAKETGSGISRETAKKLRDVGVETVDVSGAGGTSWVGVETLRATGASAELGEKLWDWGIPTAASIGFAGAAGMRVIATGGIRDGLDVARAVALGAHAGGIARVAYQAFLDGTADTFFDAVERELRTAMLLVGAHNVEELRRAPRVITGELRHWLSAD
ncbi:MAG: type 2 isopentenyl-diphosphate Delta-isomerase [Myxococcales bacterium]|nr:type 2 isopentenyl-diphosphate Delta-isomerase [Myxococcales bacterium]